KVSSTMASSSSRCPSLHSDSGRGGIRGPFAFPTMSPTYQSARSISEVSFAMDAISACWLAFLIFWGVTALTTKRTIERRPFASRLGYGLPVAVGAWLLLKGTADPHPLGDRVLPHSAAMAGVGLAITLAGLALAIWARVTLGGNWSGQVTF